MISGENTNYSSAISSTRKLHRFFSLLIVIIYYNAIIFFNIRNFIIRIFDSNYLVILPFPISFCYEVMNSPAYELTYLLELYWSLTSMATAVRSSFLLFDLWGRSLIT